MPLPVAAPVLLAFTLAGLMVFILVDSLRHGLVYTRLGVIDRRSQRLAFLTSIAVMGLLTAVLLSAGTFLVVYINLIGRHVV